MSSELITGDVWRRLTQAAKKSRRSGLAAVAYFGKEASKLLPLGPGSKLVVNASEAAVKSGQTCPADLSKLVKRGVSVFNRPNLHAKLFVFGRRAYIGSANASRHSAGTLEEAVVAISDRKAVAAARTFVQGLCLSPPLGPERLARLQRLYRPPRMPGQRNRPPNRDRTDAGSELAKLRIAHLEHEEPPAGSEKTKEAGERIAKTRMRKRRSHVLDDFFWSGVCPVRQRDTVFQVVTEDDGRSLVTPPGDVLYTRVWRRGKKRVTFVYLEVPNRRRVQLNRLAKRLGQGAKKQLQRDGLVRNRNFAQKLLAAWLR